MFQVLNIHVSLLLASFVEFLSALTGDRVPALDCRKALGATTRVCAVDDVVENLRVLVEGRVDETKRPLACCKTFFDDTVDDGSKDGCRARSAAFKNETAGVEDTEIVAIGSDIGDAASVAVVDSTT